MNNDFMQAAKTAMEIEAQALFDARSKIDDNFKKAVEIILVHKGKLVICGVGKSGHIAKKLAATFSSMGTPAVFLHATEAVHGDLGIYEAGDPTIMISKSGATAECLRIIPVIKSFGSKIISIVGNVDSPMAEEADAVLDASVAKEADPLGLAPTASSTLALALGDVLSCAVSYAKGFAKMNFARFHPAGQLGRNLTIKVANVMHAKEDCAFISKDNTIREAVIAMTQKPLGAACVVDENGKLIGLTTDGDIRRMLQKDIEIDTTSVESIMTKTPITVSPNSNLGVASSLMEDRPSKLSVLPVVDKKGNALGLLRLHDVYQTSK